MSESVRHRMVTSISFSVLEAEVKKLRAQGWVTNGEPALAAPVEETKPPYWVQAMYLPPDGTRPALSNPPDSEKK